MKLKGITKIPTGKMTQAEWLEARRVSIGGSDASAIVGLSKWASPLTVWADKTGKVLEKPETEAMRQGKDLEAYVARRFTEATGKTTRRLSAILRNPKYPFAHANIDREVVGENAGLECKTTSTLDVQQFQGGEFPEQYYAQCVHYMAVTGADRWYLAVLVLGRGFYTYILERDQAEIDALMDAERVFWGYVEAGTAPPVDGLDPTTETIQTIYRESVSAEVELFGREAMLRERDELKAQEKAIDERVAEIENTIKMDMGEAERGSCIGYRVTWRPQVRRTFQRVQFEKEHPGFDLEPYYKESANRVFKIQPVKEAV